MQSFTLILLAAILAVAAAAGQYYVPRAYYIIDSEGHESAPVPLRRLRRSLNPYPYVAGANANANANANVDANAWGSSEASANANAHVNRGAGAGGWALPIGGYGAANPNAVIAGQSRRSSGPVLGKSVTASSAVGVDGSGHGYYDQYTSISN